MRRLGLQLFREFLSARTAMGRGWYVHEHPSLSFSSAALGPPLTIDEPALQIATTSLRQG